MKIIIDIPKNLLYRIRMIIEKGEYKSINELAITALENQITLEEGEKLEEDLFSTIIRMPRHSGKKDYDNVEKRDYSKWLSIKNIENIKTFPMPIKENLLTKSNKYEESWLWGQINRIFPIKVGLRILANMQKNNDGFIILKEFHEKAGEIVRAFGQKLEKIDNEFNRKRDNKVSTAFPIAENEEKSVGRYINQFTAIKRKNNILDGAMARLKFINIQNINDEKDLIGLTDTGFQFTKLINPILDVDINSEKTLSEEEIEFYIKHIKNDVPEELNPLKHILQIINNGASSVSEMDKEVKKIKPDWTDIVVTTQRSGTLGRLNELGFLDKTKNGIKVSYKISEKRRKLLNLLF